MTERQPSHLHHQEVATTTNAAIKLWELPDVILFHIVSFVAPPTLRATVLCHQLAVLCKNAKRAILNDDDDDDDSNRMALWDTILKQDYGISNSNMNGVEYSTRGGGGAAGSERRQRRACKRLRRTPVEKVRDAHVLIKDNTEIAFFYLSELVAAKGKEKCLTKSRMCRILDEYGPHLRINMTVSSGGLFLVEVCRARHVKEVNILKCVHELVKNRCVTAMGVNLKSNESPQSSSQTALCVAAVRGMFTVVQYLLKVGASTRIQSSGRFRLHCQPKKTLRCIDATPLEFATAMRAAEQEAGAKPRDLMGLEKCIKALRSASSCS